MVNTDDQFVSAGNRNRRCEGDERPTGLCRSSRGFGDELRSPPGTYCRGSDLRRRPVPPHSGDRSGAREVHSLPRFHRPRRAAGVGGHGDIRVRIDPLRPSAVSRSSGLEHCGDGRCRRQAGESQRVGAPARPTGEGPRGSIGADLRCLEVDGVGEAHDGIDHEGKFLGDAVDRGQGPGGGRQRRLD